MSQVDKIFKPNPGYHITCYILIEVVITIYIFLVEIINAFVYGNYHNHNKNVVAGIMTELNSRVITIHKRKTTMRLCKNEWDALKDICKREHINRKLLFEMIESRKDPKLGLTPSIRLFSLVYYHDLSKALLERPHKPDTTYKSISRIIDKIS